MRYLVTGKQMKQVDQYTIQTIGIPSLVLMERAAIAVTREVEQLGKKTDHIWAVCGTGNNGADGIAAARILFLKGYSVTVIIAGEPTRGTKEFHTQKEIAEKLGITIVEWRDFLPGTCEVIIDGVFGVGLTRNVEGEYREVLEMIAERSWASIVAIDLPSGIHSTTAQVMGIAVKADVTVTFGYEKLGSILYPGRNYCGQVIVEDIGFPELSLKQVKPFAWTYNDEDLWRFPQRPSYSNKGSFGKVLLIAGSKGMAGAAYLAGLAAYRTGAGLVKILTVEENRQILQQLLPEAILTIYSPKELIEDSNDEISLELFSWEKRMEKEYAWADVIVLGPGLGQEPYVKSLVKSVLTSAYVPIILDADALNTIAVCPSLEQYYTENIIITPHLGEMSRLTGKMIAKIQTDLINTALDYSINHGIICALKDAATIVTNREGQCYVNSSGNNCMAKAGSGDVLAGTIAGLVAQGMELFDGTILGVYIHGLAGDNYQQRHGQNGLLARELAREIGTILSDSNGQGEKE